MNYTDLTSFHTTTRQGCTDIIDFYQELDSLWREDSIGFDDVCLAYKDRQYVTERPNPNIEFYALQEGSAMGYSFGLGVGAKLAAPDKQVFVFTGDGCWRLFSGALVDAALLGLRLFVLNNSVYGIVYQGLRFYLTPDLPEENLHTSLPAINFQAAAKVVHLYTPEFPHD